MKTTETTLSPLYLFLLVVYGAAPSLAAATVTFANITSEQFYSITTSNQSFDARLIEQGTGPSSSLYELGIAPFGTITTYNPTQINQYEWEQKTKTPFSLIYDVSGNLTLSLDGGAIFVEYQPTVAITEMLIGNRNQSGAAAMGFYLTDLIFQGEALPSINTNGNATDNFVFAGIAVSGFDFNDPWSLTGNLEWDTGIFNTLAYENSRAMFVGVQSPTGFVVPEPGSSLYIVSSALILMTRRRSWIAKC